MSSGRGISPRNEGGVGHLVQEQENDLWQDSRRIDEGFMKKIHQMWASCKYIPLILY